MRQRVLCYVTRNDRELLVFDHMPDNGSGVQVVGGGVEPEETLPNAAVREAWEESGLRLSDPVFLGSLPAPDLPGEPPHMRHYFWLRAPNDTPDTWDHFAEGQYVFRHRFTPLKHPGLDWGLDEFLPALERHLQETP